jgi:hypothetical protein
VEALITLLALVLVIVSLVVVAGLVARRRDRAIRTAVAADDPSARVVTGGLTAEGASTLDALGHPVRGTRQLGGGMITVAAGAERVRLWWWDRGRAQPLTTLPWDDVRFSYVRTYAGLNRVAALAVTPARTPGPRISIQPFRSWSFRPGRGVVERSIAELEAARPVA